MDVITTLWWSFQLFSHSYNTCCASSYFQGSATKIILDSGLMTFVNHGCNDTSNVGDKVPFTESNADPNDPLVLNFIQSGGEERVYNPALLRDTTSLLIVDNYEPIMKGEELLDNYITFITDVKMLEEDLKDLNTQCGGESLGIVSKYESSQYFPEAAK